MGSSEKSTPASKAASSRPDKISLLLQDLSPENTNEPARTRAFKQLMLLAKRSPGPLLSRWGELTRLLRSGKAFSKYPAVHIIAALVPADVEGRFERSFTTFYSLLDDEAISVAAHVARLSGGIVKARPALERRVTARLLALDQTHFDLGRKDLVKSYALEAFEQYFEASRQKKAILRFAAALAGSQSPRARVKARAFVKKWGPGEGT